MGHKCYLCRRKQSKTDRISFHKFPKNPIVRKKWIEICDLSETDNLTYIFICSKHFTSDDVDKINEGKDKQILKFGAVPSVGVPNPICTNSAKKDAINHRNNAKANEIVTTNTFGNVNKLEIGNVNKNGHILKTGAVPVILVLDPTFSKNGNVDTLCGRTDVKVNEIAKNKTADNVDELENIEDTKKQNVADYPNTTLLPSTTCVAEEAPIEQLDNSRNEQPWLDTADVSLENKVIENVVRSDGSSSTMPKRRTFDPVFLSQIRASDFDSPRRTKIILNLIQNTERKKRNIIKSLQNRNRALEKRVYTLKQQVAELKKFRKVPNRTGDTLLDILAGNHSTISKPKINGEYIEEIRKFAMTLYFYSPKAYGYVRKRFNDRLPNPSTIRAWHRAEDGLPKLVAKELEASNRTEIKIESDNFGEVDQCNPEGSLES